MTERDRSGAQSLLDALLPSYQFRSAHSRVVAASPEAVATAMDGWRLDRDASRTVRALIRMRGLRLPGGPIREALAGSGFGLIAERPGNELVLGTAGRFWALREQRNMIAPADADAFRSFDAPGSAKAAMSLRIVPLADGRTRVETETRVYCIDRKALSRFRPYWSLIRFFSGIIRKDLLRSIAARAERSPD